MTASQVTSQATQPTVLVVMGVSGSGKSTVAQTLAKRTGWAFQEGDDLHPEANIAKMAAGIPLDDADRRPWLERISTWIRQRLERGESGIVTCSALRREYRDILRGDNGQHAEGVVFVFLDGSREQIAERLSSRKGHFMPASLLDSQFAELQPPAAEENAVRANIQAGPAEQVEQVMSTLAARSPEPSIQDQVDQLLAIRQHGELPAIVQAGHPALRRPAQPWRGQLDQDRLRRLIELMREVMHAAPGVGLAAPQLGLSLQLAVAEDEYQVPKEIRRVREREPLPFLVMLNPRYSPADSPTETSSDQCAEFYEGCLSVAGFQAVVSRPRAVQLTYLDAQGVPQQHLFQGWAARIVQHETDHLAGTLYLDRAMLRSLTSDDYRHHYAEPGIGQARAELGF
ncbi:gluconokinase, GntK/IdnK-type [Acaricomes phytoseiuli]|uniref:gluconokinase, GntK/IdnK-type n=1 Tax=Acaricomes phytoseiuli TaxID=291968 RepID=UPI0003A193E8